MSTPPPPPPPPPPPRPQPPRLFDQDAPEPERETVRIFTYNDAVHIRHQLARERMAWHFFWRTIAIGTAFFVLLAVCWWVYTTWFRDGGFILPYDDPEPPAQTLVPPANQP